MRTHQIFVKNCDWKHLAVQVLFVQLSAGYGDYPKRLLHLFGCRQSTCGGVDTQTNRKLIWTPGGYSKEKSEVLSMRFFKISFFLDDFFFSLLSILNWTDLFFCLFFCWFVAFDTPSGQVLMWRPGEYCEVRWYETSSHFWKIAVGCLLIESPYFFPYILTLSYI